MLVLNEENIYSNFIDSVASPFTKETYTSSLKQYMTFLQINKFSDLVSMEQSRINENIKSYILHMKKSGRSTKSIRSLLNGVKSFYNMNDIENIRWKKLQKFIGEDSEINEDRAYNHEEIQRILNVADLRTKVVILLMASAGLRVGALSGLSVQHVKNDNNKVIAYSGSASKYFSFFSPECKQAIDNYLEFRERCGEKIGPTSPLLRREFDTEIPEVARNRVYPLSRAGIHRSVHSVMIKSGLRMIDHVNPRKRKEIMMAHGFRKFFKTQLVKARVDQELRELLLGHSKRKLDHVYTRLTADEVQQEYEKAIDLLTINSENRLKRKVTELTEQQDEITLMKLSHEKEMKEMRGQLDRIVSMIQENPKLARVKTEVLSSKI